MPTMQVLLKLLHWVWVFSLLLMISWSGVSKSSHWQLSDVEVSSHSDAVKIQIDSLSLQNAVLLENLSITCPKALTVYPQLRCTNGQLDFRYLQHDYVLKVALDYDALENAWAFDVQSQDGIIAIQGDSKKPDEISIQLQGYDLSQLSEDYAELDVQLPQGQVDVEARINIKQDSIVLDHYRLSGLSWESKDGEYIFADMGLVGQGKLKVEELLVLQLQGAITQGESLLGQIYTDYSDIPLQFDSYSQIGSDALKADVSMRLEDVFELDTHISSDDFVALKDIEGTFTVFDLNVLNTLALSQALDAFGFVGTELSGQLQGEFSYLNQQFKQASLQIQDFYINNEQRKLLVNDMNGTVHWSPEQTSISQISWENMLLAGTPVAKTAFNFDFFGDQLRFQPLIDMPVFDGSIQLKNLQIQQLFGPELGVSLEANVQPISLRQVTEKMGWPVMAGTISGHIPGMRKNGSVIEFDGTLNIQAFSGDMQVNNLSMERLFGVAPVIAADVEFSDFDLQELTDTLDFGEITGRLYGSIQNLRITNWETDRMQGLIYTQKIRGVKQTISQKALDRISSLGGIKGAISNSFLRFFSNFRYKKIALSCELVDAVCQIGGIEEKNGGFVIVQGGGIPEINIMGFQQRINWHEFVNRLLSANYSN